MLKRASGLAVVAVIAWATLRPQPELGAAALDGCFLCRPRAVADAILNVALFVPAGLLLGSRFRWLLAVAGAALASVGIELAQLAIPGRDPSYWDVLYNTVGAALGVGLLRAGRRWPRAAAPEGPVLAIAWAAAVMGAIYGTGWLLRPALPEGPFTVQWTPALPHFTAYDGAVLDAVLGDVRLRPGPARGAEAWGQIIAGGVPAAVVVRLGAEPTGVAPLLTLEDAAAERVLLLGVAGADVVFDQRTRAERWGLDAPGLRAPGVLAGYGPGDTVMIATVATPAGQCFVVRRESACGFGADAGDGWRLLYAADDLHPVTAEFAGALWLALLALPLGLLARPSLAVGLAVGVAWYAWIRAPLDTALLPIGWAQALGLAAGVVAGLWVRSAVARRRERSALRTDPAVTP